jgi:hypothetical protein
MLYYEDEFIRPDRNQIVILVGFEFMIAPRKIDGHLPELIGLQIKQIDCRALDRGPVPIGYRQGDITRGNGVRRAVESQIGRRWVIAGAACERKEDLIAWLHYLLATPHRSEAEVEAYRPEFVITRIRRFVGDHVDEEVIISFVVSSEEFLIRKRSLVLFFDGNPMIDHTHPSKLKPKILLASSSAVVHVGPGQGLLSLFNPLQCRVFPLGVVTL